jgi:hypothetical protein
VRPILTTVRRRAARLFYLPPVLWWMVVTELSVRSVPLPKLSARMGVPLSASATEPGPPPQPLDLSRWQRGQLRTLLPLAERWPFADGPCLRQSLVAGHILRRHHPILRLGVATEQNSVQAHAWVEVAGLVVGDTTGYLPLINQRDQ